MSLEGGLRDRYQLTLEIIKSRPTMSYFGLGSHLEYELHRISLPIMRRKHEYRSLVLA